MVTNLLKLKRKKTLVISLNYWSKPKLKNEVIKIYCIDKFLILRGSGLYNSTN